MTKRAFLLLAALLLIAPFAGIAADATNADSVLGVWHTGGNKCQVRISKKDNVYFGEVVSITQPNWPADDKLGMGGKPRTDRKNPDPKLRDRPLTGIRIMNGFVYAGENIWKSGTVYDPESGKTYSGKMTLKKDGKLELRGFLGISLLGRTDVWTR
jgi:uncharacterized protein (DUF2147 family)